MEVKFVGAELSRIDTLRFEAIGLCFFEDERPLKGAAGLCDWRLCGRISRWIASGAVTGAAGEVTLLPVGGRLPFDKLVLFGLGPRDGFAAEPFASGVARMLTTFSSLRLRTFVAALPGRSTGRITPADAIRGFLAAVSSRTDFDEVVILDDTEAQRIMLPFVEAERRRARAARQLEEG